jgi:hypothetical protein
MKMNEQLSELYKREREHMWEICDKYKSKLEYPLHPDAELRMRNDWLNCYMVQVILDGHTDSESNIINALNEYSVLYRKYTLHPRGKTILMIDVPTANGTYKIALPINKEVTQ